MWNVDYQDLVDRLRNIDITPLKDVLAQPVIIGGGAMLLGVAAYLAWHTIWGKTKPMPKKEKPLTPREQVKQTRRELRLQEKKQFSDACVSGVEEHIQKGLITPEAAKRQMTSVGFRMHMPDLLPRAIMATQESTLEQLKIKQKQRDKGQKEEPLPLSKLEEKLPITKPKKLKDRIAAKRNGSATV